MHGTKKNKILPLCFAYVGIGLVVLRTRIFYGTSLFLSLISFPRDAKGGRHKKELQSRKAENDCTPK